MDNFGSEASEKAFREFESQGELQPGEEGYWKVWGAMVRHIRPGDLVLSKTNPDDLSICIDLIEDVYTPKNYPLHFGVVINGDKFTLGALTAIILLRKGTKNTLAE